MTTHTDTDGAHGRNPSCTPGRDRSSDRGSVAVLGALALVPLLGLLATVADLGMVHARRLELQTATEAAALAGARAEADGLDACAAAAARSNDPATLDCALISGPGTSIITVSASSTETLTFAALLGRDTATVDASAAVTVGPAGSATGLRPLAVCAEHPALTAWAASHFNDTTVHRIDVETDGSSCGGDVPGNWAMIDFDGGSNSNAELQDRVVNGFASEISLPVTVAGDPGIPTPALDIDVLIGQTVTLPVFSTARNGGAGAEYDLTGIVAMEIVDVTMTGSAAGRHLDVRFSTATAPGRTPGVPGQVTDWGIDAWAVCAFDGRGSCS